MQLGEQAWPKVNAWRLRLRKEFDGAFASTQVPERRDFDNADVAQTGLI